MTFRQKIIEEFSSGEFNKIGEKALAKRLGLMSFTDKKILKETLLTAVYILFSTKKTI